MDNRLEKLEELNKLNKSGHVSDEEYKTLLSEIINENKKFEVVDSEKVNTLKKCSQCGSDNEIGNSECSVCKTDFSLFEVIETDVVNIQSIKEAGRNVIRIYYCIIFEIIFMQLYDFLVDVKIEYFKKVNGIVNDYESTSGSLTKSIINMEKIDDYIKYLEHLDMIYYVVQIILLYLFLYYLWHVGVCLKNVDEKIQ
jgi:hypothetical protein